MKTSWAWLALTGAFLAGTSQLQSQAGATALDTRSSLYLAGGNAYSPAAAGGQPGISPFLIALNPGLSRELRVSATGTAAFCPGNTCIAANPDGPAIGNTALGSSGVISGITSLSSGFLAGVFLGPSLPAVAPSATNFASLDFASFAPSVGQVFFIGNGFTAAMLQQIFFVPDGATRLYLGIADGGNFVGDPGFYDDNVGNYNVNYAITAGSTVVPEPSTYALMFAGLAAIGLAARRRRSTR